MQGTSRTRWINGLVMMAPMLGLVVVIGYIRKIDRAVRSFANASKLPLITLRIPRILGRCQIAAEISEESGHTQQPDQAVHSSRCITAPAV